MEISAVLGWYDSDLAKYPDSTPIKRTRRFFKEHPTVSENFDKTSKWRTLFATKLAEACEKYRAELVANPTFHTVEVFPPPGFTCVQPRSTARAASRRARTFRWTREKDAQLLQLADEHHLSWKVIAGHIGLTAKQARTRYLNKLDPKLVQLGPMKEAQKNEVLKAIAAMKPLLLAHKWAEIARKIREMDLLGKGFGPSDNDVKNYVNSGQFSVWCNENGHSQLASEIQLSKSRDLYVKARNKRVVPKSAAPAPTTDHGETPHQTQSKKQKRRKRSPARAAATPPLPARAPTPPPRAAATPPLPARAPTPPPRAPAACASATPTSATTAHPSTRSLSPSESLFGNSTPFPEYSLEPIADPLPWMHSLGGGDSLPICAPLPAPIDDPRFRGIDLSGDHRADLNLSYWE